MRTSPNVRTSRSARRTFVSADGPQANWVAATTTCRAMRDAVRSVAPCAHPRHRRPPRCRQERQLHPLPDEGMVREGGRRGGGAVGARGERRGAQQPKWRPGGVRGSERRGEEGTGSSGDDQRVGGGTAGGQRRQRERAPTPSSHAGSRAPGNGWAARATPSAGATDGGRARRHGTSRRGRGCRGGPRRTCWAAAAGGARCRRARQSAPHPTTPPSMAHTSPTPAPPPPHPSATLVPQAPPISGPAPNGSVGALPTPPRPTRSVGESWRGRRATSRRPWRLVVKSLGTSQFMRRNFW